MEILNTRTEIFEMIVATSDKVSSLRDIVQNDFPIHDDMIVEWLDRVQSIQKDLALIEFSAIKKYMEDVNNA